MAKDDLVFNSSYAYNREGTLVGEYSKMHGFSPAKEDKYFASGTHTTHFKLDGIPCSTVICYDIRFPELVRMAALPGTELLFVPAQWPTMRLRHWQVLNEVQQLKTNYSFAQSTDAVLLVAFKAQVTPPFMTRGARTSSKWIRTKALLP